MIDTDKTRELWGNCPDKTDEPSPEFCPHCAVDALYNAFAQMRAYRDSWRRVAERLEQEKQEETRQWRPIETAPRDGTLFLALTTKGVCRCAWEAVDWGTDVGDRTSYWWANPDDAFWFEIPEDAPTCWAPLPEAPSDE